MRRKRGVVHKGYVVNVTETCAPENDLQLIVQVQTEASIVSDVRLLETGLFPLRQRCGVRELYTDGGYNNERLFHMMRSLGIQHWQTGIQGATASRYLPLSRYSFMSSDEGKPVSVCCPQGRETKVLPGNRPEHYRARYDLAGCVGCPHAACCLAFERKHYRTLSFSAYDLELAKRRRQIAAWEATGRNPRSAVESTVWSLVRPFSGQTPVRGRFRTHNLMLGSAVLANVRRISRWCKRHLAPVEAVRLAEPLSLPFSRLIAWAAASLLPRAARLGRI